MQQDFKQGSLQDRGEVSWVWAEFGKTVIQVGMWAKLKDQVGIGNIKVRLNM